MRDRGCAALTTDAHGVRLPPPAQAAYLRHALKNEVYLAGQKSQPNAAKRAKRARQQQQQLELEEREEAEAAAEEERLEELRRSEARASADARASQAGEEGVGSAGRDWGF